MGLRTHTTEDFEMRLRTAFALGLLLVITQSVAFAAPPGWDFDAVPESMVLRGGSVFDGERFVVRDLFVESGRFVAEAPEEPDRVVSLEGRFVIPPRGDAHTHRFSSAYDAEYARDLILRRGVFYALNCCCPKTARKECAPFLDRPGGVDVAFSNGGFTCPGGHPVKLYEMLHENAYQRPPETFREENEDSSFYEVADRATLEAKWALHRKTDPDFVKVLLLYSDEYEARLGAERFYGGRGIDPRLVAPLVDFARKDGLRVGAHVENAADFRAAVAGGVSVILHTPGYGLREGGDPEPYRVDEAAAEAAKTAGVTQVTTLGVGRCQEAIDLMAQNLRALRAAGVPIAFGSDTWTGPDYELDILSQIDVFEPAELLRLITETTPRLIFPQRRIGRIAPGFEASFVAYDRNPLESIGILSKAPALVVKDGAFLYEKAPRAKD